MFFYNNGCKQTVKLGQRERLSPLQCLNFKIMRHIFILKIHARRILYAKTRVVSLLRILPAPQSSNLIQCSAPSGTWIPCCMSDLGYAQSSFCSIQESLFMFSKNSKAGSYLGGPYLSFVSLELLAKSLEGLSPHLFRVKSHSFLLAIVAYLPQPSLYLLPCISEHHSSQTL